MEQFQVFAICVHALSIFEWIQQFIPDCFIRPTQLSSAEQGRLFARVTGIDDNARRIREDLVKIAEGRNHLTPDAQLKSQ